MITILLVIIFFKKALTMPNARQIKAKIKSVKNLQKITRALEIVSTVKLQKTKKRTEHYREFMEEFLRVLRVAHERIGLFDEIEGT